MISSTQTNQPFTANITDSDYVEAAIQKLRSAGLRITKSRIRLLTALGRSSVPMTIEELHAHGGAQKCDLVTVYRNMVAFEDLGVVHRSYQHSGTMRYERKLGTSPRYRIACKVTHRAEELDDATVEQLKNLIERVEDSLRARGFIHVSHLLEFFGVRDGASRPSLGQSFALPAAKT